MKENSDTNAFINPNAATNMTMIAMVSEGTDEGARELGSITEPYTPDWKVME